MSNADWDIKIKRSDKYLKLQPGDIVQIHILTKKPKEELNHWINNEKFPCDGELCENCRKGEKWRQTWTTNVLNRKTGKTQIFTMGPMIAGQIRDLKDMFPEGHTVFDYDFKIKCVQEGKKISYKVINVPKDEGEVTYQETFFEVGQEQPKDHNESAENQEEVPF